jgi:hypothetical protein
LRGDDFPVEATLLIPFSSTVLEGRPNFYWEAEPQATSYRVEVYQSKHPFWKHPSSTNSLSYPAVSPLQPGKAYFIKIVALRGNTVIAVQRAVLNRLSIQRAEQVRSAITQIEQINMPAVEKLYDRDRIFLSQGLLSESIEILTTQLEQSKFNHTLNRLLGDRYMNAGLPQTAQRYFREAEILAAKKQDKLELAKAQAGLAEIAAIPVQNTRSQPTPH